ncbi:terminase [Longimycelium tulufanense]|uniref:terminase n=1 Tax=Longimycelium tulufanense TaxID=907463 RepID=UPI00166DA5BD|nr:terminase [Longimycelium tulufanense]
MPTSPPGSLRGARHPRVELGPPAVHTYGPEAAELLRRAGQPPDFWQERALDRLLGVREDGKWACFEYGEMVSRQNGKGCILEGRALAGLLLLGEQLIMWSAHEYKTAMESFRRVLTLLRRLGTPITDNLIDVGGILLKVINTNGEESVERLDTGQRLKFIARSKSSGRGFSGDLNLIDETFAYTGVQHAALMPTMNARPNPQIIYTSTPPLDNDSGDVLYSLRARGEAGGDDSLGWRDWGIAGDLDNLTDIDLDDRSLWAASNPALGIRITEETILRLRRSMGDVEFAREILGIWPKPRVGGGAIDTELWTALADPRSRLVDPIAFAVDTTPERAFTSIAAAGRREDGLLHVEIVDHRAGTGWAIDRVVELRDRWHPCAVVIDAGGPAGSLIAPIEAKGVDVTLTTARDVAQACGQIYDAITDRNGTTLRHLDQPVLNAAIAGAQRRPLGDAWAWARRGLSVDISPLVAVTLAAWGHTTRAHIEDQVVLEGSLMA